MNGLSTRLAFGALWIGLMGCSDGTAGEPASEDGVDAGVALDAGQVDGDVAQDAPGPPDVSVDGADDAASDAAEDAPLFDMAPVDAPVPQEISSDVSGVPALSGSFKPLGNCALEDVLQNPANAVPGATCKRYEVTCEELDPIELTLLVGKPPAGVTPKGIVTFSSGTGGTTFYNANIAKQIAAEGFITIRRAWSFDWETGPGGMRTSSCRFKTLLSWIRTRDWAQGLPLCATGNSGGATEIAYVLSTWSAGDLLDLAVPTGGPPMGRVDLGCFGGDEWESACHDIVPDDACPDEQLACTYGVNAMALIDLAYEGTPCADGDLAQSEMLAQDSCVHLGGTYDYPDTFVHVIQGREDCSEAAPLGMLYAHAITSDKEISWVDAPHGVFQSQAGALAIRDTILSECYDRH